MSSSKSGGRTRGKEKPHVCEICGKGHSSKRGLAIHANVHTREDLYRCDVCSENFSSYSLLRAHKHSHAEPKQVPCRICPKLFSTQAELTSHTLIHKAERPYECDTCGKKFDRQTLQCHMIVETGEKLYLCDACFERSSKKSEAEKSKKAKSDAKAQKKSHSDTKTYPCHLCSATYSRRQDLKKHVEKHTRHKTKPAPVEKIIEKAVVIEPPAPKEKPPPPQPAPKEKPALPVVLAAPVTPEYNRSHSLTDYVTNLNTLIKTKEALLNQKNSSVVSESLFKRKEHNPVLTSGVSSDDINKVCDANMRDVVVSKTATFHVAKSLTEHKKTGAFSLKKDGKINDKTEKFGLENEIDIFNEREAMFLQDIRDFPMIDETAIDEENDMLSLLSTDLLHAQHRNLEEQICESYSQMHVNDYFNIGLQEIARQYEDNDLLNAENFEADMRNPTLLYDHRNILSQDFNTVNNYNNLSDRRFKKTRQSGEDSGTVDGDIKVELNDESEIEINTNSQENISSTQSGKHYTNSTPSLNRYQNSPVKKTRLDVDRQNDIGGHLISEYIDIEEQSTENFASLLVNDHFSIVDHDDVDHGSFDEDDDDYERINENNTRNFSSMLIHQKRDFMTGNNSSAVDRRKVLPSERNNSQSQKKDRFKAYMDEIDIKDEFGVRLNSENHRLEFQESISPLLLNSKPVNREVDRLLGCIQSEVLPKNDAIADRRVQETIIDKTTNKKRKDSFVSDESQDSEVYIEEDNDMPFNEHIGTKVDSENRLSELMQGIELDRRPQTETRNDKHNSRLLGTVSNKNDGKGCESGDSISENEKNSDPQYFGIDHQRVLEEDYANTDDEIEHQINADNNSLIPVNVSCNDHEIIGCLDVEKSRHISRLVVKNQVFTVHLENEAEFNYDTHLNPEKSKLKKQTSTDSEIPEVEQQEIEINAGRYVIDEEEYQQDDTLSENRSVRSVDSDDINETYRMQDSYRQQNRCEEQTSRDSSESNNDSLTDDSPTTHERCKVSIPISIHRVEESDNESNSKIMTDKDSNNGREEAEEESDEKRVYVRFVYCPKNIDSGTNDSSSDTLNINRQEITRRNDKLTEVTVSEIHDQNLVTKNWTIDKKYCKLIIDQESVMQEGDQLLDDESVIYKYQSDEKDDQSFDNDTTNIDEEDDAVVQCVVQDSETDDPDSLADFSGNSNQIVVDEDTIIDYQEVEVKTDEIVEENFNAHYLRIAEDSEECVRVPMNERLIETDDDEMDAEYDNEDLYTNENLTEDQQETLAEDSEQSNQILDNECVNNDNQEIDLQSCSNESNVVYMQDSENSREIDDSSMMDYQDDENESQKGDNHESFDENQTLADESLTTNREEVVIQYDQNNSPLSLNGNLIIDHEGNVLQYTDKSNQAFGNESLIIDHQEIIGQDSNTGDSALVHCYLIDENQDNVTVNTETIDTQDLNKQSTAVQPVVLTASKDFDIESDTEKTQSSIIPTESNQWSEEIQRIAVSEHHTQKITSQHREIPSDSETTDKTDPVNHLSNDSNLIEQDKNAKEEDHLILNRNEVDEHDQSTELLNDENDSQSTSHFENQLWQDSPVHSESHSTVSDDKTQDSSDDYNYNYEQRNDNYLEISDISQEMTSPKNNLDGTPTNADSIPVIESREKDITLVSVDNTLPVSDDSCNVLTVDKDSENFEEECSMQSNNDSNLVSEEIAVPIQITDSADSDHSDEDLTKEHSDIEGTIRLFNDTLVLNDGINKSQDNILLTIRDSIDYKENVTNQTCTPESTVDIEIDQTVTLIHDKLTLHEPVVQSHVDNDPTIFNVGNDEREHLILETNQVTELNHTSNTTDSDYDLEKERDEILHTSKVQSDIVLRLEEIKIISAEGSASSTPDPDYCAEEKLVEYETNTQTLLSKSNAANSAMIILSDKNKSKHYIKTSRENKHTKKSKTLALIVEKLRARVSSKSYNVPVPEYRNDSPIDLSVSAAKISEHRHEEEPSMVDVNVNKLHDAPEIKTYNEDNANPGCDKDSGTNGVHVMDTQMKHLQLDDNLIIEHGHEDGTFKVFEVNCEIHESIVSELNVQEPKADDQIVIQENFEQDQMKEGKDKEPLLKDDAVEEDITDKSKNDILIVENVDTEMVDENNSLTNNNKQSISDPQEFGMPEDKIQTFDNINTVNQFNETFKSNECKLSKEVDPADSLNIKIIAIPEDQLDATTTTHHSINDDEFGPLKTTDENISNKLIEVPDGHLHIEEVTFTQNKMNSSANSIHSNNVEQIDPDDTVLSVEDDFSEEVSNLQDDHSKIIIQEDKMNSVDNTNQVGEVDVEVSKPFEVYVCKEKAEQQINYLNIEEKMDSITNTDRSKTNIQINAFEAGTLMEYNLYKETVNMQESHLKMEDITTLENKIDSADNIGRIEEVDQADAGTLKSADDDAKRETTKMQNVLDLVVNSDYSNKGDAYIFETEKTTENNFNKDTKDIQIDEVCIQNDETDASANTEQSENVKEVEVDQFLKSPEKYLAKEMIEAQNINITIQEYPMHSFKNTDHIDKVDQIGEDITLKSTEDDANEYVIILDNKLDTPEITDHSDQAIGEITLKSVNHLQEVMDIENDDNTDKFNQVDLTLKSVEENLFLENDPLNIQNYQDNETVLGRKDNTEEILKSNDENIVVDEDHEIKDQSNTCEEETDPVRLVNFNIVQERSSLIETTEPCAEFLVKEKIEPINISDQMEIHEIQVEDIAKEEVLIIDPIKECQRSAVLDDTFRTEIKKSDCNSIIFEEHKISEDLSTSDDNPTSVESLVIDEENQYLVEECDQSDVSCRDSVTSDCEEITCRKDCLDIQIVENSQTNCTINKKSETSTLINENIPSDHEAIDPKDSLELVQSNVIVSAGEGSPLLNDIQLEMENQKILVSQDMDFNNSTADKISNQESCNTAGENNSHLSIYHQVIEAENRHLNVEHNETEPLKEEVLTVINEVVEEPKSEIIASKYSCDDHIVIADHKFTTDHQAIETDHNEIEMKDVHPESSINHLIVIRETTNVVPSNLIEINIASQLPDCTEQHMEYDTQTQVNDVPAACEIIESEIGHVDIEKEVEMESTQIHEIVSVNNQDESINKDKSDVALIDVEQSRCHEIVDANQCIIHEISDKEDVPELTVDNDTMVDKTENNKQNEHQEMEMKSGTEVIESQINYKANVEEGDNQKEIVDSPNLINTIDETESGERIIENCVEDNIKLVKADVQEISISNVELVTSDNISGHDAHVDNIQSSLSDNFKTDGKVVDAQNELINAECLIPEPKSNIELFTTLDEDNLNEDITESSLCLDEQYQDNKRRHMPLYSSSLENLSVIETPHDISIMEHSDVDISDAENESSLLLNTDSPVINLPLETSDSKAEQLDQNEDTTEEGYSSYDTQAHINYHLIATPETVAQNEIPNDKHLDEKVECEEVMTEAQIDNQIIIVQIDETDTQPFSIDNLSSKQSMKIEDSTEYHNLEIDNAEEKCVHVSKDCLNINDEKMSSIEQTNNLTSIDPNKQQVSEIQDDEEHVEIDMDLQENCVQIISNPLIIKNQETVAPVDVIDIKKPTDTNFATKINVTETQDSDAEYKQLVFEHSNFSNQEIAPIDSIDNQRPTTDSLEAKQQSIEVQYDHKHDDTDEQPDQEPCVKVTQDLYDNREKAQIYDQLDTNMPINDSSDTNNQTMEENNDKTYYVAEMQLEEIKCGQIISDCSNDNNQEFTSPLEQTNDQTININEITINDHSMEVHDDNEICDIEESPSGEKIVKVTIDSLNASNQNNSSSIIDSIDTQILIEDNETINQEAVEKVIQKGVVIEIDERKCLQVMSHDLKLCNQEISTPNHTVNNHIPSIDNLTTNQQVMTPQDDVETRLNEKESVIEPIDHFNIDNHEISTVNTKIMVDDNSPIIEETEAVKVHLRKYEHEIEINEEKIQEVVCDHLNVNNQQIAEPIVFRDVQLPSSGCLISEETELEVENENKQDTEIEHHDHLKAQNKKSESPINTPDAQISISDNLATKQPPIMQDDQEHRGNYLIAENQDTAVPIDPLENEKSIGDTLVTKQLSTVQGDQEHHDSEMGHSEEKCIQLASDNLHVSQKNMDSINQTDIKIPDKVMFATDPQILECHQGFDMEVDVRKCVEPDQTNLVISSIDTQNSINDNLNENTVTEEQDIEVSLHEVKCTKPDDEHSSVNEKIDSQILITDSLTTETPYTQNDQTQDIDTRLDELKSKCDHADVNEENTIPIDEMPTQTPIVNNVTSDQPGIEAHDAETGVEANCGKPDHDPSKLKSDDDQVNVNEEITIPIDLMHTQILIADNVTSELAIEAHVAETGVDEAKCGKPDHGPSIDIQEMVVPIDTIDIQIPTDYNLSTKPPAIEMQSEKSHLLDVQLGEAEPALLSSDSTNIQLLDNILTVDEHDQQENHYVHEKENIEFNDQWVIKCEEIILPTEDIYTSTPEYSNDSSDSLEDIPSVKHIQTQTNFPISFEDEFSYIKFHDGKVDSNKNNINIPNRATEIECENEESLPIGELNINCDEFVPIEETENAERASALFAENCLEEYEQVANDNLSIGEEITEVQKNNLDYENVFENVRITSVYSEQVTEVDSEILMAENDKEADASILKHFNSNNNMMIIKQIERFMDVHNVNQGISEVDVESNKNLDSLAVLPMDANAQMLILEPQLVDNFIEEPAGTDGCETLEDRLIIDDKEIEGHNSNEVNPGIILDADDSDPGVLIEYIDMNNTFIEEVCNSEEPFSLIDESDAMIDLQNDDLILDNQNIFDDDQEIEDRNKSAVLTRRDHSYSLDIDKGFFKEFGPLNKSTIVKVLVGIKDGNGEIIYKEIDTRVEDNTQQSIVNPDQEILDATTLKYTQHEKNNSGVCDHPCPEVIENIEVSDSVDRRQSVNEDIEVAPQTVSTDIVGWKKYKRFFSDRKTNDKSVTEELLTKLKNNGSEVDVVLEALKKSCPSIKNIMNEKHALKNLESATANNATVDNLEKRNREVRTAVQIFKKRLAYEEMKKISTKENNIDRNLTEDKKAGAVNNMNISDVHNNKQLSTDDGTAVVKNNVSILNKFKRISITDKVNVIKNIDEIGETNNNSPRINAAISSLIHNKSNDTATGFAADKFKNKIVIKGTKRGFDKPLIISQLSNLNRNKNILEAFIKTKDNAAISKPSDQKIPMNINDTISTCQSEDVINKTDVLRHRQPTNITQVLFKPYEKRGASNKQIKTIVTPEKSTEVQQINEVQECISVVAKNSSHDVVSLAIKTLDMYNVPENVRNNILTTNKQGIVSINNRAVVKLQKINIDKLKEEFISTNLSRKYKINNLNQRVIIPNDEEKIVTSKNQINLENHINNSTDQSKSIASKSDIPTEVIVVNHNVKSILAKQKDKVSSIDVSVNDRITDANSALFVQSKKYINILNVNENCNAKIIKPVRRILKVIRCKNGKISTLLPKKNDSEIFIINPAGDSNEHRVISNNLIKNIDKKTSKRDATALEISDNLGKSTLKILSTRTSPDAVNVKGKVLVTMPNKKQLLEKSFSTTCDRLTGKIDNNNELNAEKNCKLSKNIHIISTEIINGPVGVVTHSSNSTERNLDEIIRNNETVLKTLEMCSLSQEVRKNLMCVDQNGEVIINDEAFIELGKIINNIEMPPEILQKISKLLWDNSALKNNADTVKNNYGSQEIKEYLLAAIDNRRVSVNLIEDLTSVLKESRTNSGLLANSLNDSGINERKSSVLPTNESLSGSTKEPIEVIEDLLSDKNTSFNAASETVNKKSSLTQRRIIKINAPKRKIIFPLTNTNDKVKFKKIYLDSKINIKRTENRILTRLRGNSIKTVEDEQILQDVQDLETPEQNDNETCRLKENIVNLRKNSTSHENILNLESINVDNNLVTETMENIRNADMTIGTEEEENLKNTLHNMVDSSEISEKNKILKRRQSVKDIYDTAVILKQNVQDASDFVNETDHVTSTNDENGKCLENVDEKNSDSSLAAKDAKRELKRKRVDEMELLQDLKDSDDYIVVIVGDKGAEIRQLPAAQEVKAVNKSFDSPKAKKCRFEKKNKNKRAGSKSIKTVAKEPTTDSSNKRRKRKNLGVKEFPCTQCDKVCKFSNALLVHMRIHTNERPFACDLCDKRFKVKSALKCHSVVHTADRPFECDQCNKRFKTKTVLESHMRFHVGEKRFECDICNKKFIQKQSLMIHLNLHTGATPWACDICFKRFKQPATLVKHHRSHTVKRPYSCTDCRKYFSTSAGLRTHRKMHDKEQEILNS